MDSSVKTNVRKIVLPEKNFFTEMQELNIPVNNLTLRFQQKKRRRFYIGKTIICLLLRRFIVNIKTISR